MSILSDPSRRFKCQLHVVTCKHIVNACLHWHTNAHILKTYHLSFQNESCNNKPAPLPGCSVCTDSRMTAFQVVHFHNKITQAIGDKTLATPTTAYYQVIKIVWHSPVICITALLVVYNTPLPMCNRKQENISDTVSGWLDKGYYRAVVNLTLLEKSVSVGWKVTSWQRNLLLWGHWAPSLSYIGTFKPN